MRRRLHLQRNGLVAGSFAIKSVSKHRSACGKSQDVAFALICKAANTISVHLHACHIYINIYTYTYLHIHLHVCRRVNVAHGQFALEVQGQSIGAALATRLGGYCR
ncbi:unnamed protein product [Ceratitis capitata]|uniref:(Mediterranean fruit fly) hypothetical protein n=1 Tax=Ceratitis capitata TaxID=7213 RepID=A0A811VDM3_CERCA|nr:unnamed protein product [Ceratitis capitata]